MIGAGEWMPEAGSESTGQARAAMGKDRIGVQKPRNSGDKSDRMRTKRSRNGLGVNLVKPMSHRLDGFDSKREAVLEGQAQKDYWVAAEAGSGAAKNGNTVAECSRSSWSRPSSTPTVVPLTKSDLQTLEAL